MGLTSQSVHPMDVPKTSSFEEYENDTPATMSPSQRIADQQYQNPSESPRGSDLAAATGHLGQGNLSSRAATNTASPPTGHGPSDAGRAGGGDELPPTGKSERQLVFADESGGVLAEITYSSRTHYSKQVGNGALPAGRACCVIS